MILEGDNLNTVSIQKHVQVRNLIMDLIEKKQLLPGQKLPSIREMCDRTGYNSSTIVRAYRQLTDEGAAYSMDRSGYYVMDVRPRDRIKDRVIDFITPSPDKEVLPYKDYLACISMAGELYGDELFMYGSSSGFPGLRKTLARILMNQQLFVKPDDISITSGSQQALDILSRMEFPNRRDVILVEQPAYIGVMRIISVNNMKALGIERRDNNLDLERLENIFSNSRIKFFYTTPRFSNPLGLSYDCSVKKEIARLAKKYDVYIVEDDYLADIDMDNRNDPIYTYDDSGHIIYIKSFSKTFLPGIRIGMVILPDMLKQRFEDMKWSSTLSTSVISQGALEIYLKSGMFEKHIRYLKDYYYEKSQKANELLKKYMPEGCSFGQPVTGFFNYIKLPYGMDDEDIALEIKSRGVLIKPCRDFFLPEFMVKEYLRICISSTASNDMEEGISIIAQTIMEAKGHTPKEQDIVGI